MFYIDDWLWIAFIWLSTVVGFVSLSSYIIMVLLQKLCVLFPNNLKKRYNAEWALVTGASSGIGKALAEQLAGMGLNVVLVALDTQELPRTLAELEGKFPKCRFRRVPLNLGDPSGNYMSEIVAATEDIDVQLVFNNAGYILPGMIPDTDYNTVRANVECNAVATLPITHHFTRLMIQKKKRGLVEFTSSAAGYFPGPTATTYSATKAFVTNLAVSMASDLKDVGIDVIVMHPSPVMTNFYKDTADQMGSLKSAMGFAVPPTVIASEIIAGCGRVTVWDQGFMTAAFRVVNKIVDFAFVSELIVRFGWLNGDHKRMAKASKVRNPGM